MKRLLVTILFALALIACTEDFDAFGTSDYRTLDELVFENQDGDAQLYPDEHRIDVNLIAPSDSFVWDSVTIERIKISRFASLHLVESKVRSFPSDSAKLDSLAQKVAYSKKSLKAGSRLKLPRSGLVYLMAVSESGEVTIWQVVFNLQGGNAETIQNPEDSDDDSGNSDDAKSTSSSSSNKSTGSSSSGKSDGSSSGKELTGESSSSEAVLDSNVSFSIKFVGQLESREMDDTIRIVFANGTDLSKVKVDSSEAFVFRKSMIDSDPAKVKDWSKVKKFVVTSESGTSKIWYVDVRTLPSSEKSFEIVFKNELKSNRHGDTIVVRLENGSDMEKISVDSWSVSAGASISPDPDSVKNWSKLQKIEIVAEDGSKAKWFISVVEADKDEVVSDEKELLSVKAKNEVKAASIDESKKTVLVHMKKAEDLADVEISIKVSPSAYINLESRVDLRQPQKLVITAEDKSTAEWTVSGDFVKSSEAEILSFALDDSDNGFSAKPNLDAAKRSITFTVPSKYESKLSKVYFDAEYSEGAKKKQPAEDYLDLSDGSAEIVVVAEDGAEETWTVSVTVDNEVVVPRLLSMKIAGNTAVIDSADEGGMRVFHVHYDNVTFLTDLKEIVVSDIELTEGATVSGISEGNAFDLSRGLSVSVSNGEETAEYVVQAGYQYPGSDFNHWVKDSFGNMNAIDGWDNGNNSYAKTLTVSDEGQSVIKMESQTAVVKFASGNMLVAYFNPKDISPLSMATYGDGNELIDFGRPFRARPRFVEFDAKYQGKGDSCDMYVMLEHRSRTSNEGKNQYRTKSDVNTLIASAWYRATTVTSMDDPDVVSITDAKRSGYKTIRLAFKYGVPLTGSPIYSSSVFNKNLKKSEGIDNHLVQTESPDDFEVTHIRVVMASSALGNLYKGAVGATLWVDEMRLIY
jgi:hypothetical protein